MCLKFQVQELELAGAKIYFGGVPPDITSNQSGARPRYPSLLGSIRGITTSNPGIIKDFIYNMGNHNIYLICLFLMVIVFSIEIYLSFSFK